MKQKALTICGAILVFLLALGITLYPLISNWYNEKHRSEIHTQYQEIIQQVDTSELDRARELAHEYNAAILPGTQLSDAFSKEALLGDEIILYKNNEDGYDMIEGKLEDGTIIFQVKTK